MQKKSPARLQDYFSTPPHYPPRLLLWKPTPITPRMPQVISVQHAIFHRGLDFYFLIHIFYVHCFRRARSGPWSYSSLIHSTYHRVSKLSSALDFPKGYWFPRRRSSPGVPKRATISALRMALILFQFLGSIRGFCDVFCQNCRLRAPSTVVRCR